MRENFSQGWLVYAEIDEHHNEEMSTKSAKQKQLGFKNLGNN
jgi:hypothetical protein